MLKYTRIRFEQSVERVKANLRARGLRDYKMELVYRTARKEETEDNGGLRIRLQEQYKTTNHESGTLTHPTTTSLASHPLLLLPN